MKKITKQTFTQGQIVKFKNPSEDEKAQRFVVLEDRDDRVLVQYICDLPIRPQHVYPKQDLIAGDFN